MVGLTTSTEEKLVGEKEQNMFYFSRKSPEFLLCCMTTIHFALFLFPWTLSTACNDASDRQTNR